MPVIYSENLPLLKTKSQLWSKLWNCDYSRGKYLTVILSNQLFKSSLGLIRSLLNLIKTKQNKTKLNINPSFHLLFSHFLSLLFPLSFPPLPLTLFLWGVVSVLIPHFRHLDLDLLTPLSPPSHHQTQYDISALCVCTSAEPCRCQGITQSLVQVQKQKGRNKASPGESSIGRFGQKGIHTMSSKGRK